LYIIGHGRGAIRVDQDVGNFRRTLRGLDSNARDMMSEEANSGLKAELQASFEIRGLVKKQLSPPTAATLEVKCHHRRIKQQRHADEVFSCCIRHMHLRDS
jgi:hypothetical protein